MTRAMVVSRKNNVNLPVKLTNPSVCRYAGRTGVVSSNVFQKTVDYPEEAAEAVHVLLDDETWVTVRRDQVATSGAPPQTSEPT